MYDISSILRLIYYFTRESLPGSRVTRSQGLRQRQHKTVIHIPSPNIGIKTPELPGIELWQLGRKASNSLLLLCPTFNLRYFISSHFYAPFYPSSSTFLHLFFFFLLPRGVSLVPRDTSHQLHTNDTSHNLFLPSLWNARFFLLASIPSTHTQSF